MKLFIKNRKGQKVSVLVEEVSNSKGLAIVMNGLGGFKEQVHMQVMADAFKENSYSVVRFDTTNSFGESEGSYEKATTTNYYEDLEDVIKWVKQQSFYKEPFILAGHSLGSLCIALYAEKHPKEIKALAPISTVVSGKLSAESPRRLETIKEWKRTGWEEHISAEGKLKRLPWSHMEDRLKYDLMPNVSKLTMPVLLIVGEKDDSTPPEHQKILFDKLPGKKEIHTIKGSPHTFREKEHLDELKRLFMNWIKSL